MILIDTGPLVALCDSVDQYATPAKRDLGRLGREQFGICVPVVAETFFHLRDRFLRRRLKALLDAMSAQMLALEIPDDWEQLCDWFDQYANHAPDFADGYLVSLCGRDHRLAVWTYDRQFSTIWRRPDGTRIPLAVKID